MKGLLNIDRFCQHIINLCSPLYDLKVLKNAEYSQALLKIVALRSEKSWNMRKHLMSKG